MGKHEANFSKRIEGAPGEVWAVLTDTAGMPSWFPGCTKADNKDGGRSAKGVHRFIELDHDGKVIRSEQEITAFEPEKAFGWRDLKDTVDGEPFEMLADSALSFEMRGVDGGTQIEAKAEWRVQGLKGKLAAPIVKKVVGDQTAKLLDALKKKVEG